MNNNIDSRFEYPEEIEPFSVSERLLKDVFNDSINVEKIDGYQGDPITGIGDVYTPKPIVDFILDTVGYTPDKDIEHKEIADLSCGTGSFIREIVKRLRDRLIKLGYNPESPEGARQIISTVRNNVFGYDINSLAVWRTAQIVLDELRTEIISAECQNPVSDLPIYHANSLKKDIKIPSNRFDFIVGNPPYIKNRDIKDEDDQYYREKYTSATGKYDIYLLFFERAIELLFRGGYLGFVTPDRFHQADYGKKLRDILTNRTQIKAVVKLEDDPFPVVNTYPCISILKKKDNTFPNYQEENILKYCEAETQSLNSLNLRESQDSDQRQNSCSEKNQDELGSDSWRFISPEIQSVKSDLDSKLTEMGNTGIQIRAGIATGADRVFIVNETEAQRISNKIIYPIIKGENVMKGDINQDLYIINPYDLDGKLIDIHKYQNTKVYLEQYRSKLEERYCVRENDKLWYETHDTIRTNLETQKRIVTPDLTSKSRFAITERTISHNTCYSIFYDTRLKTLAAVMNSSVFEFLLKSALPKMESGFWRQMKRDLVDIPVILPEEFEPKNAKKLAQYYDNKEWDKIDRIIYQKLDLKTDYINKIESFNN